MGYGSKSTIRLLRSAGETETMQANIHDWLELDERNPGFQFIV
jgi:hypothetical protein